jgi:hypothetical protein
MNHIKYRYSNDKKIYLFRSHHSTDPMSNPNLKRKGIKKNHEKIKKIRKKNF